MSCNVHTRFQDDQKSIAVTRLDVSLQSSFDKFKDKSLDASSVGKFNCVYLEQILNLLYLSDFSDSVNRQPQSGFKVQPDDLEVIVTEREPETILQRYQRLKQEVGVCGVWDVRCVWCVCDMWGVCNEHTAPQVADLASDVGRIEEGSKDAEKLLQVSPPDLLQDVSQCIKI